MIYLSRLLRNRMLYTAFVLLMVTSLFIAVTPTYAATFVVTKTANSNDGVCDADCSLREAITAANSSAGADTVSLSVTGTYTLGSEIAVTSDITLQESAGITATLSGGNTTRLFTVSTTSGALTLIGLTVENGSATTAGGCIQVGASSGGSLTFTDGLLQNCVTSNSGGAIGSTGAVHSITISGSTLQNNTAGINGGAISETGTAADLSISDSTFSGNRAGNTSNAQGGAILYAGQGATGASFSVTNSTFSTNVAQSSNAIARGGAIHFTASDAVLTGTISGSTFTGNQALNGSTENSGGAIYKGGVGTLNVSGSAFTGNSAVLGGAFYSNQGTMSVTASRIESNTATGEGDAYYTVSGVTDTISGSCIVNNGDTAVYDAEAGLGGITTATGNWWGTNWGPQITAAGGNSAVSSGDSINGSGFIRVNVGLTNPNSTPPTGNWLTSAPTVAGAPCASIATGFVVTKTADTNDGVCNAADCSLREAITAANAASTNDTITFAAGANGTITLTSNLPPLENNGTLTITGNGPTNTIISGNDSFAGLLIDNGTIAINNLTITRGTNTVGGGLYVSEALSVSVNNVVISDNNALIGGGASESMRSTLRK